MNKKTSEMSREQLVSEIERERERLRAAGVYKKGTPAERLARGESTESVKQDWGRYSSLLTELMGRASEEIEEMKKDR